MDSHHRRPVAIVSLLTFVSILAFISLAWNAPALGSELAETLAATPQRLLPADVSGFREEPVPQAETAANAI